VGSDNGVNRATVIRHIAFDDDDDDDNDAGLQKEKQDYDLVFLFLMMTLVYRKKTRLVLRSCVFIFFFVPIVLFFCRSQVIITTYTLYIRIQRDNPVCRLLLIYNMSTF